MTRVWTWRHAVVKSALPSTTKHVLLTLSLHMNEVGEGCYPPVEDLCEECSLSKPAVIKHLAAAEEAGWLRRQLHGLGGQKWARYEYVPIWPEEQPGEAPAEASETAPQEPEPDPEGGKPRLPPSPKTNEKGGKPGLPPSAAQQALCSSEGGKPDDNALCISSIEDSIPLPPFKTERAAPQQEARSTAPPCDRDGPKGSAGEDSLETEPGAGPDGASGDLQGLTEFRASYPIPSTRPELVEEVWGILTPEQRAQALKGGAGYAVFTAKHNRKPMDPARFLRSPALWAEFAPHAPKTPVEAVFVPAGPALRRTGAWRAWAVWRAMCGDMALVARRNEQRGEDGAWFAAALPPPGEALANCDPDPAGWPLIAHGTREWWAWDERWRIWTGKPLEADVIATGETELMRVLGQEREMPVKIKGRRLPSLWPPPRRAHDGAGESDEARQEAGSGEATTGTKKGEAA